MLNVIITEFHYAECHYAEGGYAKCRCAECHCSECHYTEFHYAEYHYAEGRRVMLNVVLSVMATIESKQNCTKTFIQFRLLP